MSQENEIIDEDAEFDAELSRMLGLTQEEDNADPQETDTEEADTVEITESDEPEPAIVDTSEEEHALEKKAKAAERRMHEATQSAAEARRREEALSRQNAELEAKIKALETKPNVQDDTELDDAVSLLPELVPLVKRNKELENKIAALEENFGKVTKATETLTKTAQETAIAGAIERIEAKHPDAQAVVQSEGFTEWRNSLPPMMAQAIYNAIEYAEPKDVIMAIDMYKQSLSKPAANGVDKEGKLAAAKAAATPSVASSNKPQAQTKTLTREDFAKVSTKDFLTDDSLEEKLFASLKSGSY